MRSCARETRSSQMTIGRTCFVFVLNKSLVMDISVGGWYIVIDVLDMALMQQMLFVIILV